MKRKIRRFVSGFLAVLTTVSVVMQPVTSFAAEVNPNPSSFEEQYPEIGKVKDALAEDEIVTAYDYEIEYGASFDVSSDFSGIKGIDNSKVRVKYYEAKNDAGESFNTYRSDTYKAVYTVEPVSGNPSYRISRNITVKEAVTETATEENTKATEASDDGQIGQSDTEESDEEDGITESEIAEFESEIDIVTDLTEDTENTTDSETGLMLSEAVEQAADEGIDLYELEEGETVTFMATSSKTKSSQQVSVTKGTCYHYSDYGYGSYLTYKYTVKFGNVSATAYCIQPSKSSPGSGTYSVTKLSDGKALAKVCYYGTKVSGDDGFFTDENGYGNLSAGARFILVHLAASYANNSSDAFSGANSTAQSLAKKLYNYCISQPDIPDVEMSFSNDNVKAYVDGNIQRTEVITFKADEAQTITMKLPSGVKLHNETTGKTSAAGASVEICGGTKFYLTAPLTQVTDVAGSWSATMKGSITKDYSAYKVSTGSDTQELALVFGEGVDDEKYVDFKVSWVEVATVEIVKKDSETAVNLAGAVYGIYSDKACTKLITKMPATDSNGASSVTIVKTQDTVYLKEISVPVGYLLDTNAYNITLKNGQTTKQTVTDKRVNATIHLVKKDKETGDTSQGDATLKGAVYGLYAREDIVHPDKKTGVIYKAGTLVATLTTDGDGKASVDNLYLGKYYVKEITPSNGYLLDETEYDLNCEYEGALKATVECTAVSNEQVIKQPFQLIKVANNGKTDADLLSGAGFTAYLVSSLTVKNDGSYDFDSATPVVIGENGATEIFTDKDGYAESIALPFGTYIVRETTTPHNYKPVDDFIVRITENNPTKPQTWRVLLDNEFKAKLKIIKQDDETKKSVLLAGTEFKVFDIDKNKYVEQVTTYPTTVTHKSYFTDSEGYLILPNNLSPGNYRIEEVTAPDGYTINHNYVEIKVDTDTMYQIDETSEDAIIEVVYENHPVKGKLEIVKKGEVLSGYKEDFQYEMDDLAGAVFEVYAAEDIYTADYQKDANGNRILEYEEGALVATLTTGEDGKAVLDDLPLGAYKVVETTAPDGFVLNSESQKVTFVYLNQNTPVVSQSIEFVNERQKVEISVVKKDAENGNTLAGAKFGLYAKEDIVANGEVIVEADTMLGTAVTDEDGKAVFSLDVPFGNYYVKELVAPAGFVSSEDVIEVAASYKGQDISVVKLESTFENQPTTVEFTKSDVTTGVELDGATLTVLDKDGNEIDKWVSVKDEPHVIKRLTVGETYILREELAPYGYLQATDVEFTVSDTAEVQKVEMKDEVPTALLIINKKGEFLENVSLLDNIKGKVEHLFEYVTGNLTEVTFEVYAAEEIKAADGVSEDYYSKDDLVGTITTDQDGIAQMGDLPVGKYYVKEVETAYGYVLDEEPRYVDLSYRDQNTAVVTYDGEWLNERQKVTVNVLKLEKGTERVLSGAVFGLYATEDIKSASGKVLIKADEIIEQKTTDANGTITFVADLPIGTTYYIKEVSAPDGFVTNDEKQEFTFEYQPDTKEDVVFDFTFENEATTVEITKTDLTNGEELPGAKLQVTDENGNVVDAWTSTTTAHIIKELVVGEKYTLTETKPADGYVTAESIEFVIADTAEVQKIEMKDDVTKVEISKQDIAGKELPGATLTILDAKGNVVDSWVSTEEAHYIEMLPIGEYTLREESAPNGYLIANDVKFEVKDTAEVQHVVMVDEAETPESTETPGTTSSNSPKTGDDTNLLLWLLLAGGSILGLAGCMIKKKKI